MAGKIRRVGADTTRAQRGKLGLPGAMIHAGAVQEKKRRIPGACASRARDVSAGAIRHPMARMEVCRGGHGTRGKKQK